ncbi:MAG: YggT family protein [Chloroflexi bacterium]|nr:YggT family protein [Chloroflexota bacterium]
MTRTDVVAPVTPASVSQTEVTYRSSGTNVLERLIIFLFALIQGLLILRIVLLLVAARQGNDLVALIYDLSDIFVAPFRGILGRNQIPAGSTDLDVAAIVALIGWTIVELIILGFLRVFRRTA